MEKECEQVVQEKDDLEIRANNFINKCKKIKQKILGENEKEKTKEENVA